MTLAAVVPYAVSDSIDVVLADRLLGEVLSQVQPGKDTVHALPSVATFTVIALTKPEDGWLAVENVVLSASDSVWYWPESKSNSMVDDDATGMVGCSFSGNGSDL